MLKSAALSLQFLHIVQLMLCLDDFNGMSPGQSQGVQSIYTDYLETYNKSCDSKGKDKKKKESQCT